MTIAQKTILAEEVERLANKTSQVNVSHRLEVSNATISNIINGVHESISDAMWRKVQKILHIDFDWVTAHTGNYKLVYNLLSTAKSESISLAISDDAGKGKTHTYREFSCIENNVIHIECKNYWTKKAYIQQLLINTGVSSEGTTQELIKRFIEYVRGLDKPLIIIDQFDKLKDPQMDLFMDFYNDLNNQCGFLLSGVKAFEKRVLKGVNRQKIGYSELFSRIGRKFIHLKPLSLHDVELIAKSNGVVGDQQISYMYQNSDGDFRRIRRDIDIIKLKKLKRQEKNQA